MVVHSEKIKKEGIAVLRNVTMLPSGEEPFVSSDYVICIGHRGRMDLMYEDMPKVASPRDIAIIFPNHEIKCVHLTPDFKASLIVVDAKMIDDPMLHIIRLTQYRYEACPDVVLGKQEYKILLKMVDVLHEMATLNMPDKRLLMLRHLENFLRMLGHYRQRILDDVKGSRQLGTLFRNAVAKHFRQHHDVAFYADILCLTPKYFSHLICQQTGHTAAYWIRHHVTAEAKILLKYHPHLSIQSVSELLGFGDQQSFSRFFKNQTELSPTEFRNKRPKK